MEDCLSSTSFITHPFWKSYLAQGYGDFDGPPNNFEHEKKTAMAIAMAVCVE
jgi:hypothetical protein